MSRVNEKLLEITICVLPPTPVQCLTQHEYVTYIQLKMHSRAPVCGTTVRTASTL